MKSMDLDLAAESRRTRLGRARQWMARAFQYGGPERQSFLLIVKATLAATIAWSISFELLNSRIPAFAPFSAVLMVQESLYRSLQQTLRHVFAVIVGVLLQGLICFAIGSTPLAFGLVTLLALILSRGKVFGHQGFQITTAAFFAFSVFAMSTSPPQQLSQLLQIVGIVLLGCVIGIVVNLAVWPPLRYRSAERGVRTLAHSISSLVDDMAVGVKDVEIDSDYTDNWRWRAKQLPPIAAQARSAVLIAHETMFFNPRRLLRHAPVRSSFSAYSAVVAALDRVSNQLVDLTRTMDYHHGDDTWLNVAVFRDSYGDFLTSVARLAHAYEEIDEQQLTSQTQEIRRLTAEATNCSQNVAKVVDQYSLPMSEAQKPHGVMLVEADRLRDEFQYAYDVLRQQIGDRGVTALVSDQVTHYWRCNH